MENSATMTSPTRNKRHLANELLVKVFGSVESSQDLSSISKCSKRFNEVVEPFLYTTFSRTGKRAMVFLLRSLMEKIQLGKYFKHIKLSNSERYVRTHVRYLPGSETPFTYMSIREVIRRFFPSSERRKYFSEKYCDEWVQAAFYDWSAMAALILLLCSANLETVQYHGTPEVGDRDINYATDILKLPRRQERGKITSASPILPKLRQISFIAGVVDEDDDDQDLWSGYKLRYETWIDTHLLWKCLKTEQISEIRIDGLRGEDLQDLERLVSLERENNSLKFITSSLIIQNSDFIGSSRHKFLSGFSSLQRLEYHHFDDAWDSSSAPLSMEPYQLRANLKLFQDSLQELILVDPKPPESELLYPGLGCLRTFKNLRLLDVDQEMLLGPVDPQACLPTCSAYRAARMDEHEWLAHVLPASLERLVLRNCTFKSFEAIFLTLDDLPKALKEIHLVHPTWLWSDELVGKSIEEWRLLLREKGIEFSYVVPGVWELMYQSA